MQPHMYQPEPNLIAETYRNHIIELPRRFEKQYDFIDVNQDGLFLLGTSNLTGRIWSGSLWLFNDPSDPPDVEKCLAGMEFESGIPHGQWFDDGLKVVVGTDSGAIHVISHNVMTDNKKHYLSTLAIATEHDDSISALDVTTDSLKIISGSMDMNINIWDTGSVSCEKSYDCAHVHTVTSVCWQHEKDDIFISTSTDGTSLIWDTHLEKPASLLMRAESGYTTSCWINENTVALGANSGSVSLVDLRMKSELDRNFCSKRPIYRIVYNKDSQLLAVCADDPIVRVFDCSSNLLNNFYECERHMDFARGLTWKSSELYSCAWDSKVLLHTMPMNGKGINGVEDGDDEAKLKDEEEK